jgi:hypothetical protein
MLGYNTKAAALSVVWKVSTQIILRLLDFFSWSESILDFCDEKLITFFIHCRNRLIKLKKLFAAKQNIFGFSFSNFAFWWLNWAENSFEAFYASIWLFKSYFLFQIALFLNSQYLQYDYFLFLALKKKFYLI